MNTRFSNHVSLPEKTKTQLIQTLNIALATTLDLHSQVKQAHWNIKGPQFFARHELFDNLARQCVGLDRVGQLGSLEPLAAVTVTAPTPHSSATLSARRRT